MSAPIDYATLAELAEALDLPGAAHLRASADDELVGEREDSDTDRAELDELRRALDEVPEPAKSTKHSDTCWQRHARCLADRLLDGGAM